MYGVDSEEIRGNTRIQVKYKEMNPKELRKEVIEVFRMYNTALLPLEECVEEILRLINDSKGTAV